MKKAMFTQTGKQIQLFSKCLFQGNIVVWPIKRAQEFLVQSLILIKYIQLISKVKSRCRAQTAKLLGFISSISQTSLGSSEFYIMIFNVVL